MRAIFPDKLPLNVLETGYRLGKLVHAKRKIRKISQIELCEMAGIARSTLLQIERGSPRVQFAHWLVVLSALDLLGNIDATLSAAEVGYMADAIPGSRKSTKTK